MYLGFETGSGLENKDEVYDALEVRKRSARCGTGMFGDRGGFFVVACVWNAGREVEGKGRCSAVKHSARSSRCSTRATEKARASALGNKSFSCAGC